MTRFFLIDFSTYFNWRFLGISGAENSTLGPLLDSTMNLATLHIYSISSLVISSMIPWESKGMVSRLKLSFTKTVLELSPIFVSEDSTSDSSIILSVGILVLEEFPISRNQGREQ